MISINQLAKMLGIPAQTIRMYEHYGIFESFRTKSNYRKFDRHLISTLIKSRMLQSMGLSMKQISQLTKGLSYEDSLSILKERELVLTEELILLEQKHRQVKLLKAELEEIRQKAEQCEIVITEDMYLFPVLIDDQLAMSNKELRTSDLSAQERWNEYAFARRDAAAINLESFMERGEHDEQGIKKYFYSLITAEDARCFRLDVSRAIYFPSQTCVKAYAVSKARTTTTLYSVFRFAADYVLQNNLIPIANPLILLPLFPQISEQDNYFSMLIPIKAPQNI